MWHIIKQGAKKLALNKAKDKAAEKASEMDLGVLKKAPLALFGVVFGFIFFIIFILVCTIFTLTSPGSLMEIQSVDSHYDSTSGNSSALVQAYLDWAINIANDDSHGYSQCARTGPDYDCSSLVWYSLVEGAKMDAETLGGYAFTTYVMGEKLKAVGFTEYEYTGHQDLLPGDILVFPGDIAAGTGHTEIYVGEGKTVGAHIAETGGICGLAGDQTGGEIDVGPDGGSNWEYYYRLEVSDEQSTDSANDSVQPTGKIKILFVGNSRTYVNDIPSKVKGFAKSDGYDISITRALKAGKTLYELSNDLYAKTIESDSFNCVVMQEQTETYISNYNTFLKGAKKVNEKVKNKNPNTKVYVRQTWAKSDFKKSELNSAYSNAERVASAINGYLIYDGKSFDKVHSKYPNVNLFQDERHQSNVGAYVSAAAIYKTLFGNSVSGNDYKDGIDSSTALKMRKIVDEVIPYSPVVCTR